MNFRKWLAVTLALSLACINPALAQNQLPAIQGPGGPIMAQPVVNIGYDSGTGQPCVVGKVVTCVLSATGGGGSGAAVFTPTSATSNASLSVTTSSQATALPTGSTQIVENIGSSPAYVTFSVGAGTATTAGYPISAGTKVAFAPSTATYINYITASGTTTLTISGGSGGAAPRRQPSR